MILTTSITINWSILPFILGSMILIWIATTIVFIRIYKIMIEFYEKKDYEEALTYARRIKYFPKNMFTDHAQLIISYCYLNKKDIDKFIEEISKLKSANSRYLKYYWMTFINLYRREFSKVNDNFDLFVSNPPRMNRFNNGYSYDELYERLTVAMDLVLEGKLESNDLLLKLQSSSISSIEKELYQKLYEEAH